MPGDFSSEWWATICRNRGRHDPGIRNQVRDEDVARLWPLGFEHINMLGRYAFTLPDTVARGELRPLRNPASAGEEADEPALT